MSVLCAFFHNPWSNLDDRWTRDDAQLIYFRDHSRSSRVSAVGPWIALDSCRQTHYFAQSDVKSEARIRRNPTEY